MRMMVMSTKTDFQRQKSAWSATSTCRSSSLPNQASILPESDELQLDHPSFSDLIITEIHPPPARARKQQNSLSNHACARSFTSQSGGHSSDSESELDKNSDTDSDTENTKGMSRQSRMIRNGKKRDGMAVEPPDDPFKVAVFRSVLYDDKIPHPPPELDCQTDGPGKVRLTAKGSKNRHVYIKQRQQKYLLDKYGWRPRSYLVHILEELLGARGWNFIFARREEQAKTSANKIKYATLLHLLTDEFVQLLHTHMEEKGLAISEWELRRTLKTRFNYYLQPRRKQLPSSVPEGSHD
ncbi:hypothetical protein RvY_01708-3 [Ramazzottius varieornatus]|uniref:Uncharacterized protein n=1 Tax=Ramazzottius varieornatus TaxID=947166 RepID=A0A1D1UPB4_RAMVA|nr:hypothetical protein RvY_01708-3 [Ramazzottius varieornatus]